MRTKTVKRKKKRKENKELINKVKRKGKENEKLKPGSTWRESQLIVYECESIRISYQEHNEMAQ